MKVQIVGQVSVALSTDYTFQNYTGKDRNRGDVNEVEDMGSEQVGEESDFFWAVLISVSVALSHKPAYAARLQIWG